LKRWELKLQWFKGKILNYDPTSGQYGVFFPSDNQTIYIYPNDKEVPGLALASIYHGPFQHFVATDGMLQLISEVMCTVIHIP